jgi:hypothetical protein
MTDIKFKWYVQERRNVHVSRGKEWALNVEIRGDFTVWTIATWKGVKKPSNEEIQRFLTAYSQGVEGGILMARKALTNVRVEHLRMEDET